MPSFFPPAFFLSVGMCVRVCVLCSVCAGVWETERAGQRRGQSRAQHSPQTLSPSPSFFFHQVLAHNAVHAAFAGYTGVTAGLVSNHHVLLPIPVVVAAPKTVQVRKRAARGFQPLPCSPAHARARAAAAAASVRPHTHKVVTT